MAQSHDNITNILERVPPQNIEAEQSFLGSLLIDKEAITRVLDAIHPDDFYRDTHRIIYEAMLDLYNKREPIDILSLTNILEERDKLELVGGRSYLVSLTNSVPTASHVKMYGGIIQKKSTLRRLLAAANNIARLGYAEEEEVDVLIDQAEQSLFAVSSKYLKRAFIAIRDVLADAFERIDELHKEQGKLRGISTGFDDLDKLLSGFQRSDLIIIAARPSIGKTSLALDFARHAAVRGKQSVGIFSLEMSQDQLVDRMLCAEANVDLWRMRTGRLSETGGHDDFPRIGHAMGVLAEASIFIDDTPNTTIMEIRAKARRLQSEHGLGLIVLDYLQLMEGRGKEESRVQEISQISRGLKGIARELNIPVIALSQLSRGVEQRSPAIPKLSDLRDSGAIEQDADVVMFIYRKKADKSVREVSPEEERIAQVYIAKHRNGPTGQVNLYFDEGPVSFRTLEKKHMDPFG